MLGKDTELRVPTADKLKGTPANSLLVLNIMDKEDSKQECWAELKVKDKFINKRSYHASVVYKSRLYVYGGQDLNVGNYSDFNYIQLNEELMLSHWEPVITKTKASPGPLSRMISVCEDDKWYLFGGTISATENTSDIWCFDFTKNEWSLVKPTSTACPPTLDSHSGGLYKAQGKSYIVSFGGFLGKYGEYWNQVIKYDISANKWILPYKDNAIQLTDPSGPHPRGGHTSSIFNGYLYIFGGRNGEIKYNDIWRFDLSQDTWLKIKTKENPPPRNGHTSLVYNNQGLVIFGGIQDITHEKDDLLFFNFTTNQWTVLEGEHDHVKAATIRNNEKANESGKLDRSNRGKSLTESPNKTRSSQFKDTKGFEGSPYKRGNTRIYGSPSKRGNTRGFEPSQSPSRRAESPESNGNELSPNRYNKLGSNNSFMISQNELRNTGSPSSKPYQGLTKENEEKKRKLFLIKKQNFLKEFEVTDPSEASMLTLKSPTTEAMKNSIIALTYKGPTDNDTANSESQSPLRGKKKSTLFSELMAESFISNTPSLNGKVNGRKPCARDGHTSVSFGSKMLIFGGDRHKMSFNDLYMLNMKQMIAPHEKDAL